jgi:hypothetical protein
METWESLQARLFHLGWLGEELPEFVARPSGAWLFRQIVRECQTVAAIAAAYVAETERAGVTGPGGNAHPDSPDATTDGDLRSQPERGDAL